MARYTASLETALAPAEAFDYLSDFSTTQEWDPGVVEAELLGAGPVGEGSKFRVVAEFLGRESTLVYEAVAFEPGRSVTLRGENASVVSLDRIDVEPGAGNGAKITYDADLKLKGPLRLADPLLRLAFNRVGDRALEGLRETLAGKAGRRSVPT